MVRVDMRPVRTKIINTKNFYAMKISIVVLKKTPLALAGERKEKLSESPLSVLEIIVKNCTTFSRKFTIFAVLT